MAEGFGIAEGYRKRAKEELEASRVMLGNHFYAAAISRAYYAVYYAITALLMERGVVVKTHRQAAIEFRKRFIKTKHFDVKYSDILDELFNVRMLSDYDAIPEIDEAKTARLLSLAKDFVEEVTR